MKVATPALALLGLVLVAACSDSPLQPQDPMISERPADNPRLVSVMTRNLYVGADVDAVIGALATPDPSDDLPALMAGIATLQATDFGARARAIAGEIAAARPQVVGLQEVYQLKVDLTPLGLPVNIDMDYLAILQQALADRHLPYIVAGQVRNTEAAPFPGISLVDFDVMLIDPTRVVLQDGPVARQYAYNIGPVAPGVDIRRGFIVLRAQVGSRSVVFANTHLESGDGPQLSQLRAAQASELMAVIGGARTVVVMGDLNDTPGSPMSQVIAGAGFHDAWGALRPNDAGLTCCHAPDLSNPVATFTQRIDWVWERGVVQGRAEGSASLAGAQLSDRIAGPAGPIWPSDHAGLVVSLR